jgi:hypothetical protein
MHSHVALDEKGFTPIGARPSHQPATPRTRATTWRLSPD